MPSKIYDDTLSQIVPSMLRNGATREEIETRLKELRDERDNNSD